jgi:hypothetical protein
MMTRLWLVVLLLPSLGFAWRGIHLLIRTRAKPGQKISASGVAAAISMFLFVVVTPFVLLTYRAIFQDFGLDLPAPTERAVTLLKHYAGTSIVLRCTFGLMLSFGALILPEVTFNKPRTGAPV